MAGGPTHTDQELEILVDVKPTDILREWASAVRGDWSMFDGRGARQDIETIANLIDEEGRSDLILRRVLVTRSLLDLCPHGRGHWTEYCTSRCADG